MENGERMRGIVADGVCRPILGDGADEFPACRDGPNMEQLRLSAKNGTGCQKWKSADPAGGKAMAEADTRTRSRKCCITDQHAHAMGNGVQFWRRCPPADFLPFFPLVPFLHSKISTTHAPAPAHHVPENPRSSVRWKDTVPSLGLLTLSSLCTPLHSIL